MCAEQVRHGEYQQRRQQITSDLAGAWLTTTSDSPVYRATQWLQANLEQPYNLQAPQSAIAQQIYDLHTLIFIICCVIFVLVFGVMTYSIIYHRKSVGHKAEQFHENTMVEIAWTVVPFIILIGMAIPATKTVLAMKDTSSPDITIKATGYQWKWGYDYLHEGVSFYSALSTPRDLVTDKSADGAKKRAEHANYLLEVDNHVVVPVGKKIRILTTANDVIHSWAVPAFGVCKPRLLPALRTRDDSAGTLAVTPVIVLWVLSRRAYAPACACFIMNAT